MTPNTSRGQREAKRSRGFVNIEMKGREGKGREGKGREGIAVHAIKRN